MPWKTLRAVVVLGGAAVAAHLAANQIEALNGEVAVLTTYKPYAEALFACMSAGENKEEGGFAFKDSSRFFDCKIREI